VGHLRLRSGPVFGPIGFASRSPLYSFKLKRFLPSCRVVVVVAIDGSDPFHRHLAEKTQFIRPIVWFKRFLVRQLRPPVFQKFGALRAVVGIGNCCSIVHCAGQNAIGAGQRSLIGSEIYTWVVWKRQVAVLGRDIVNGGLRRSILAQVAVDCYWVEGSRPTTVP
jgi:hypothetical protein